jgi:hypothetical protein
MYTKNKRKKEELQHQRRLPEKYRLVNIPSMTRKRLKRFDQIREAEEEWRIRTNYLKLNKGYGRKGESGLLSKLKKREHKLLPPTKNSSRCRKYKISHINRITQKIMDRA